MPTKSWKNHPYKLLRIPQIHVFFFISLLSYALIKIIFPGPRNLLWILQLAVLKIDSRMRDISKRQIVSHWIDGKRWTKNKYWDGQKGHSRPKYRFAVHLCTMVKDGVKKYPTIIHKDFFIVLHNYNPLLNISHN